MHLPWYVQLAKCFVVLASLGGYVAVFVFVLVKVADIKAAGKAAVALELEPEDDLL